MGEAAVTLARYVARLGYRECAFWGVDYENDDAWECRQIWSRRQREDMAYYLREAQEEIEQEIGYFLAPTWVVDERHRWGDPLVLRHGYVLSGGVRTDTLVGDSLPVDHTGDPATVTLPLGDHDPADLRIYHEDTDIEITPDGYSIAGGSITFRVPRCRLVAPAYADNPAEGLDYDAYVTWAAQCVDVRAVANDTSVQAALIWRHTCNAACALRGCADYRQTACLYVRDARRGVVDATRADYADGVWVPAGWRGRPDWVLVSYLSGLETLPRQAEDAIIRLAHSKMAEEPEVCAPMQRVWQRDRHVPGSPSKERLNCPFGMSDGAWAAWRYAQTMKLGRASVL